MPKADTTIGMDYKSDGLYVDSDGICANILISTKILRNSPKFGMGEHNFARKGRYRKGEKASNNGVKRQLVRCCSKRLDT